ncbi:glycosyltransferase family 4 protein [Flavobacteriaceae bacterium LMO-SS05]
MIIVNARFLSQRITGVQRFAIEICKRLPKKVNGREIVYVAPNGKLVTDILFDFELIQFGRLKGQLWDQIELPIFLKSKGNPPLINFVGIAPIFYKRKVMFLYDLAFKHHPEWFSTAFHILYNLLVPISLKNSLLVITDSNYVKGDIHKTYGVGKGKIQVLYAATADKFLNKNLTKEKIILTVSSIDPRKNINRVIKAFSEIKSEYKLVIVGSKGKSFSNIQLNENRFNDNIIFTGYLSDDKLIELYNKAEIFIYASLFEGFGIPPLEAQACNCACIVSNVTSLPEVYQESVEYCDPYSIESIKNVMGKLMNDSSLRNQLRAKGLENVKRFHWSKSANEFVKIIEGIL